MWLTATLQRVCGSCPPIRSDGTLVLCHQTVFRILEFLAARGIHRENVQDRLYGDRKTMEELLRAINLHAAYYSAAQAVKMHKERQRQQPAGNGAEQPLQGVFCPLICKEIEACILWAERQVGPGGERLLWTQQGRSGGSNGDRRTWEWCPSASSNYQELLAWYRRGHADLTGASAST